jgi:hypothetical protein
MEGIFQRTKGHWSKQREVNIYAIVLSFSVPKLTRKGHWMMNITVTDESISSGNDEDHSNNESEKGDRIVPSMTVTIFRPSRESLPLVLSAGDILRCHRVMPDVGDFVCILSLFSDYYCLSYFLLTSFSYDTEVEWMS